MQNQADDHTQQLRHRTIAMLETAIEREIDAMGEEDARDYIETVFCRVAAQRAGGGNA